MQNLTPQLRTRLSRLERWVGVFLLLATLVMVLGLAFYLREQAKSKGWFKLKMPYFTFVRSAAGLKVGDKVKLMGFDVGEITEITAQPVYDYYDVYVAFYIKEPFYGYLWSDSRAKVVAGDFLGGRYIEVSKGVAGLATYEFFRYRDVPLSDAQTFGAGGRWILAQELRRGAEVVAKPGQPITPELLQTLTSLGVNSVAAFDKSAPTKQPSAIWTNQTSRYLPFAKGAKGYFMEPAEAPAVTERLEKVANLIEAALPGILTLTNKLSAVLATADRAASNVDHLVLAAQPILTNATHITTKLNAGPGALGEWLLPTNLAPQLQTTLATAHGTLHVASNTLDTAQTTLRRVSDEITVSLANLASLTSNLNAQVQANSFILSDLSSLVTTTDELVQGLQRHWLLKGAFRPSTNAPAASGVKPRIGGPR